MHEKNISSQTVQKYNVPQHSPLEFNVADPYPDPHESASFYEAVNGYGAGFGSKAGFGSGTGSAKKLKAGSESALK
jgi:hypothetical protein